MYNITAHVTSQATLGIARVSTRSKATRLSHGVPSVRKAFARVSIARSKSPRFSSLRKGRGSRLVIYSLFEKFTERSIKSVMLAQEWTRNYRCSEVTPSHILLGLISEDSSKTGLLGSKITIESARKVVDSIQSRNASSTAEPPKDLPFSPEAKRLFENSLTESRRMGMSFIGPEHILLAVLSSDDPDLKSFLQQLAVPVTELKAEALRLLRGEAEVEGSRKKLSAATDEPKSRPARDGPKALDEFCRDLCAEAAVNKIDPIIGRSKEVARVAQILARRTKNNPILLGEPGVGKTAIAEGLARAIVVGSLPDASPLPQFLKHKRVLQLDVGLLIAGAKERGELESRVTRLLAEAKEDGNVILMVDEVHTLVGAGAVGRGGGGGLDIANLLKPALARGDFQCIGATTLDEHRKYIEKDSALERRFQPVIVDEPDEQASLEILEGLVARYERHHRVLYAPEALQAAVLLSSRYIADRHMPDKCIDLIDEAGSRVRIAAYNARCNSNNRSSASDIVAAAYGELAQVIDTKEEASQDALFEEAALLRAREMDLKSKLSGIPEEAPVLPIVSAEHIRTVVSAWTGVPVETMNEDETDKLRGLGDSLRERIVGQENAVDITSRAVARAAAGLKNPRRPIAALLFSGPTGVGKTELAKALAEAHFGAADAAHSPLIRLDMSEYMERHSVSKLIGSPPGYVGYGDGGKLTETIRRRPFSLVLFDEIEKAHPDIFNIMLQILEEGRLTDAQGRVVSFKNALIVLTTNVGSSILARGGTGIGFELPDGENKEATSHSRLKSLVMEELKNYFRPELLNRLDEVVVFRRLSREDVAAIAQLEISKTAERAAERGIGLQISPEVMDLLQEQGFSESMGARELRRAVTRFVDDALSEAIVSGKIRSGQVVCIKKRPDGDATEAVSVTEPISHESTSEIVYEEA